MSATQKYKEAIKALYGSKPIVYIKFCKKKEFAECIINGNLYANTPEYFRNIELETGIRGQGDKYELISERIVEDLKFYDRRTNQLMFTAKNGKMTVKYKSDDLIPLVSFIGIPIYKMNLINEDNEKLVFGLPFTCDQLSSMKEQFGEWCVIVEAAELEEKIKEYCQQKDHEYCFEKVIYCCQNERERMIAFDNGSFKRVIYKNEDLKYQREYRLAIDMLIPDDHFLNIGKIDKGIIIEPNENIGDFIMKIPNCFK